MLPKLTASAIYSTLGNNSSLVPLAVKDVANSLGLTAGSYVTGDSLEGKDRFLDEFGTQAIWLFGLPVYKKITDLTLYRALKIDPKVDVRMLKHPELLDKAIELSPYVVKQGARPKHDILKEGLIAMKNNPKFSKTLMVSKFGIATLLTIFSYASLTKYRHKKTREAAKKEILAQRQKEQAAKPFPFNKPSFSSFLNNRKNDNTPAAPSFTGMQGFMAKAGEKLQNFMFDPVQNLMIVDGTITTERLKDSRNKQEFIGYSIKEGATWAFMYFASKPIQKFLENRSVKKHNHSIDLDARVIESEDLRKAFANKAEFEKQMKAFPIKGSDVEIYEFLHKNPDNVVVKMAKKSDEIITLGASDNWLNKAKKMLHLPYLEIQDKDAIDTRRFLDIGDAEAKSGVKGIHTKLNKLYNEYLSSGKGLDEFLNMVKKHKRNAVKINLGSCVAALGVAVPLIMIGVRYLSGNKDFQVKEDLEKELNAQA